MPATPWTSGLLNYETVHFCYLINTVIITITHNSIYLLSRPPQAPGRREKPLHQGQITGSQSDNMIKFSSAARQCLGWAMLSAHWLKVQQIQPRCPASHPSTQDTSVPQRQAAAFCLFSHSTHSTPTPEEICCILFLIT